MLSINSNKISSSMAVKDCRQGAPPVFSFPWQLYVAHLLLHFSYVRLCAIWYHFFNILIFPYVSSRFLTFTAQFSSLRQFIPATSCFSSAFCFEILNNSWPSREESTSTFSTSSQADRSTAIETILLASSFAQQYFFVILLSTVLPNPHKFLFLHMPHPHLYSNMFQSTWLCPRCNSRPLWKYLTTFFSNNSNFH